MQVNKARTVKGAAQGSGKDEQEEFLTLKGEQTLKTIWQRRDMNELYTMEHLDEIMHSIKATVQDDKKEQADKNRWQRERPDGVTIDTKKINFTLIEYK